MNPHEDESLLARQIALEQTMVSLRQDELMRAIDKAQEKGLESTTLYGSRLIRDGVVPLAKFIRDALDAKHTGPPSVPQRLLTHLSDLQVAYISLRYAIDNLTRPMPLTNVARTIGDRLEWESQEASRVAGGPEWVEWTNDERIQVGVFLIGAIVDRLGYLRAEDLRTGKKVRRFISISDTKADWINDSLRKESVFHPTYLPMIMPPADWSGPHDGGYRSTHVRPLSLVKMLWKSGPYFEELASTSMPVVYSAVNAMQRTAWQINRSVHRVISEAWTRKLPIGGLPIHGMEDIGPEPANHLAKKQWQRRNERNLATNAERRALKREVARKLHVADMFVDEERIFFPYQLDFRGRVYAVPLFLNPQGDDIAKGLLTFADGKPLGTQRAADWLAIHGANEFGKGKEPLHSRLEWVREHTAEILASAADPLGHQWWLTAKKPWKFLAFCFEWAGYQREGLAFVSHLPIALDGTCNGLQHFSAMLRDAEGGRAVNLTATSSPHDVYQVVAERVKAKLKSSTSPFAPLWSAFGITRDTTKVPVMTAVYGSTLFAMTGNWEHEGTVEAHLNDRCKTTACPFPTKKERKQACAYLGVIIKEALDETVAAAKAAMDWLTKVGGQYAEANPFGVIWIAPSGFPAVQRYPEMRERQIVTKFCGSTYRPKLQEETEEMNVREMAQGMSPNFVHSLDAAHLMLTVSACAARGLSHFAIIHDSFATLAADTDTLREVLREEFQRMYAEHDVLGDFLAALVAGSAPGATYDQPPERGELDLTEVLRSEYVFS